MPGSDDLGVPLARGRAALAAGAQVLWSGRERSRRPRTTASAVAAGLHDTTAADVMLTVTSWNTSRMALQADLLGLDALGVHALVCETGNPPVHADRPVRDGVWEVDAVGPRRARVVAGARASTPTGRRCPWRARSGWACASRPAPTTSSASSRGCGRRWRRARSTS